MPMRKFALLLVPMVILATGCQPRFKGIESHNSALTPNGPMPNKGDKYATSGIGEATGGIKPATSYPSSKPGQGYK